MKLVNPKKRTQLAHITNLITMARLDGVITDEEKQFIFDIANQEGITQEEFEQCFKDSDKFVVEVPRSKDEKRQYLKNVIGLMMADGKITEEESRFAFELGYRFFGEEGKEKVNELYNEIVQEMKGQADNTGEMTDEEIREEVKKRIENGVEYLKKNEIAAAFDALFPAAIIDETARDIFLRIVHSVTSVFKLYNRQLESLKELADKGYAFAQLTLGRYHQLCRPDKDSIFKAEQYCQDAYKGGMPDALTLLAIMVRDGYLGLVDPNKFIRMRNEAYEKGSFKALELIAKDFIFGHTGEPRTEEALEILLESVTDKDGEWISDPIRINPALYDFIGLAYDKLGDKENAEKGYLMAVDMGCMDAFNHFITMKCLDSEGNIVEREAYSKLLEIGCDFNDGICYSMRGDMSQDDYEALNPLYKGRVTSWIKRDLIKAYELGDNIAPWLLGCNYYYGNVGFEENNEEAWKWFSRGALYSSADSYKMLAQMVEEGNCPDEDLAEDENYVCYCKLYALRLGSEDMLIPVVKAYKSGFLTDFASEIEQYYLPKVSEEDLADDEEDDDYEDDDGRFDAWA